ncbi:MAG: nicotinate-nucleotide adenylyltransferase [Desulfobacca sp.]|nr:nicotinate-nucleotide adenylyltransferase [Desulfobacca sp.]
MIANGVAHGRFQVLHHDHLKYLLAAKGRCQHLVVAITNPDPTLTKYDAADPHRSSPECNPLTYYERYQLVKAALGEQGFGQGDYSVVPFPINFPELYRYYVPLDATFFLTIYDPWGEKKLQQFKSLGLQTEVLWRKPKAEKGLRSTEIRRYIALDQPWEHLVPLAVTQVMKNLGLIEQIKKLTNV